MKSKIVQTKKREYKIYRKWLCFWILWSRYEFSYKAAAIAYMEELVQKKSGKAFANKFLVKEIFEFSPSNRVGQD